MSEVVAIAGNDEFLFKWPQGSELVNVYQYKDENRAVAQIDVHKPVRNPQFGEESLRAIAENWLKRR